MIGRKIANISVETNTKTIDVSRIHDLDLFSSNVNLRTASEIANVKTGYKKLIVVVIRSAIPYSDVVNKLVYKGVKSKVRIFDPKLLMANSPVSVINFLYLFI